MTTDADNPQPRFVSCHCKHCDGGIEFDANQLPAEDNATVPCPHCGSETIISAPELQGVPPIISEVESYSFQTHDPDAKAKAKHDNSADSYPQPWFEIKPELAGSSLEFVGQNRLKARIQLAFDAAEYRGDKIPHVLLVKCIELAPGPYTRLYEACENVAGGKTGKIILSFKKILQKYVCKAGLTFLGLFDQQVNEVYPRSFELSSIPLFGGSENWTEFPSDKAFPPVALIVGLVFVTGTVIENGIVAPKTLPLTLHFKAEMKSGNIMRLPVVGSES